MMHKKFILLSSIFIALMVAAWMLDATPVNAQAQRCDQFQSESIRVQGANTYTMYCNQIQGAGVGDATIVNMGFMDAVDIYGYVPGEVPVCLRGLGGIIFLNKSTLPPSMEAPMTWLDGGFTCANIGSEGIVVLVANGGTPPPDPNAPVIETVVVDGEEVMVEVAAEAAASTNALDNCRVTTSMGIMNLRAEPTVNSESIDAVPYGLTLTAIQKSEEWFNVIFKDTNGWLSGDYLEKSRDCE